MNETPRKPATFVLWIVHFAFMAMVPVYAYIFYALLSPQFANTHSAAGQKLSIPALTIIALAIVQIPIGLLFPNFIRRAQSKFAAGIPNALLAGVFIGMIVSDAFFESIAIYGMIGCFMEMQAGMSYALIGLSFILLAFQIPRVRGWIEEANEQNSSASGN
jgi:hypothetical protein